MSISGLLQEFRLTDLIQTIAKGRRSGKLRLSSLDSEGLVVFRKGKIIYAASSSIREPLGSALVRRGLITQQDLDAALGVQHQSGTETRLGNVLIEMGLVSGEVITQVISEQTSRVLAEFLAWPEGHFTFDTVELPDRGEIEVDAHDFIAEQGLRTDQILLEIADRMDRLEARRKPAQHMTADSRRQSDETRPVPSSFSSLRSLLKEVRSPRFTGRIANKITDFADEILAHWTLFTVARNGFRATASTRGDSADLLIPHSEPSVLCRALDRQEAFVGTPTGSEWDRRILDHIGNPQAETVVVAALRADDQTLLILCGTDVRPAASPNWLEELELLFLEIGLRIERDLVERKSAHLEELHPS